MSVGIVFLAIIFLASIGYMLVTFSDLYPKKNYLTILGCSYGLGVGCIAMQLYLYARFGISWSRELLLSPWILLFVLFLLMKKPRLPHVSLFTFRLKRIDTLLVCALLFVICYVLFESLLRPLSVWDGWAIWLLKAKIFFLDGTIHPDILNYVRSDYPLIISLLGTFVYIVLGYVNDASVLLAFFAFYAFLLLFFFSVLQERFGTTYALFCTFLLATLQTLIRQGGRYEAGQADLALGYFIFICTVLLLEYIRDSKGKTLLLLSVFLAITGLTKSDGIPFTVVVAAFVLLHIAKQKLYKQLFLLLVWVIPVVDWQMYLQMHHIRFGYLAAHPFFFSLKNTVTVFTQVIKEFLHVSSWQLLWVIYFYSFFVIPLKKNKELLVLHAIVLSQIAVYILLYITTLGNNPQSSFERLLVHVAPVALYAIAIGIASERRKHSILIFSRIGYTLSTWMKQSRKKKR